MKSLLLLSMVWTAGLAAACLPVTGDRILGRDLALADTRFGALPANLQLAYAPVPGVTRVFAVAELQRIARTNGIDLTGLSEVCFEMPVHIPDYAEFLESMRRSLPQSASLRLVEIGRAAIPAGRIEFPASGLEPLALGNDGVQLWRGFVQYTDTRKLALWARVIVTVSYAAVITRQDLAADVPIAAGALRVETRTGPLQHEVSASSIEEVAGRVLQRPRRSGAEIPLSLLCEPPVVRRGDSVKVEVQSGRAVLRFYAIAQTSVRAGETAEFRNPTTGKVFRARITAESTAAASKAVIVVGKGPA